ncbi:MAG: hypothetical protein GY807_20945 [Gammaproteobacteria bacterium]|nr:hypothetical protein [Gammaproteobacteria bacterium]
MKNTQTKALSLKNETVERLEAWMAKQPARPKASAVVDSAINGWLDKHDGSRTTANEMQRMTDMDRNNKVMPDD